ncbi:MAG: hypothetical protein GF320_15380 [Armatimonadia bacterium]|nr:hypothetical protein [Armatimonadia bacterium]
MPEVFSPSPVVPLVALWHFALGLTVGSFMNVCIYRLPRGLAVTGRSHCPSCGTTLRLSDLIPLFSQVVLGSRCRYCGARFSWRYFGVEALIGALLAGAYLLAVYGPVDGTKAEHALWMVRMWIAVPCLVAIVFVDFETYTIPDGLVVALVVIGVASDIGYRVVGSTVFPPLGIPLGGGHELPLLQSIQGAVVGFGGLWLLGRIFSAILGEEAMGYGDVKLMAGAGALLGPGWSLLGFFLLAVALGAVGGIAGILIRRLAGSSDSEHRVAKTRLPFGPFLAVSLGVCMLQPEGVADVVSMIYLAAWSPVPAA